jgi:hypothetical protein
MSMFVTEYAGQLDPRDRQRLLSQPGFEQQRHRWIRHNYSCEHIVVSGWNDACNYGNATNGFDTRLLTRRLDAIVADRIVITVGTYEAAAQ